MHPRELLAIARKTLGLPNHDKRTVPEEYLEELSILLAVCPGQHNFLFDIKQIGRDDQVVTCLDCLTEVPLVTEDGFVSGLPAFEDHIQTPAHIYNAARRAAQHPNATSVGSSPATTSSRSLVASARPSPYATPDTSFDSSMDVDDDFLSFRKRRSSVSSAGGMSLDDRDPKRARSELSGLNAAHDAPIDFWAPVVPGSQPIVLPSWTQAGGSSQTTRPTAGPSRLLAALNGIKPEQQPGVLPPKPVTPAVHPTAGPSQPRLKAPMPLKAPPPPVLQPVNGNRAAYPQIPGAFPKLENAGAFYPQLDTPVYPPNPPVPPYVPGLDEDDYDSEVDNAVQVLQGYGLGAPHGGDFNLNIDANGPMGHLDHGGPNQQAEFNAFFMRDIEDVTETATVRDALETLGLRSIDERVPGLEVKLLPHQVIGVCWMIKQENDRTKKGGILADDMGLGKTVQMIATIVMNPPPKTEEKVKTTLIVVPASLLDQWREEIENKAGDALKVFVHHGDKKLESKKQIRKYDIVITSYHTLTQQFPVIKKKRRGAVQDDFVEADRQLGPLAKTHWYRIVLDEAQFIRNRITASSLNVASLEAEYRWSLTGTPVTNSLSDLYALIRFGRLRPWNDWQDFNRHINHPQKKRPQVAAERAQAMLKPILMRRTKTSQVEGKPILQLGPKTVTISKVQFSARERQVYDALERRQREKLNRILERGRLAKDYHFILVMILRLRQACNHTQLISFAADEFALGNARAMGVDDDDAPVDKEAELERAKRELGAEVVAKFKQRFRERAKARMAGGDNEDDNDALCPICLDSLAGSPRISPCQHEFCRTCIEEYMATPINQAGVDPDPALERRFGLGIKDCPVCRRDITLMGLYASEVFEPSELELQEMELQEMERIQAQEQEESDDDGDMLAFFKANAKRGGSKGSHPTIDGIDLAALDEGKNFKPSAKMVKMVQLLKEWQSQPIDGRIKKVILYSQWTSMIDLVQILLNREGMENVRYDGKMNRKARELALSHFKRRDGPNIMIISLKCGGVGLNLTEASCVISLDLAWNPATELQAQDRVHRLGQQQPVFVERLVVENTIEDRILALQQQKQDLSDIAMGEGVVGKKIKRLTARQLKALFGM